MSIGQFDKSLQIGVITPLHKLGSKSDKTNYRPITVLPIFGKIFEYVILRRLERHFLDNKIFNPNQFGYTNKANTEICMIHVLNDIYVSIDAKQATSLTCID